MRYGASSWSLLFLVLMLTSGYLYIIPNPASKPAAAAIEGKKIFNSICSIPMIKTNVDAITMETMPTMIPMSTIEHTYGSKGTGIMALSSLFSNPINLGYKNLILFPGRGGRWVQEGYV